MIMKFILLVILLNVCYANLEIAPNQNIKVMNSEYMYLEDNQNNTNYQSYLLTDNAETWNVYSIWFPFSDDQINITYISLNITVHNSYNNTFHVFLPYTGDWGQLQSLNYLKQRSIHIPSKLLHWAVILSPGHSLINSSLYVTYEVPKDADLDVSNCIFNIMLIITLILFVILIVYVKYNIIPLFINNKHDTPLKEIK